MFAILTIVTDLFRLKDQRILVNPLCLLGQLMALTLPATMREWEELVTVVHPLRVGIVYILTILVISAAALMRNAMRRRKLPDSSLITSLEALPG
ncbi:hypothetical protein [Paenibacillus sp. NEAU-GSW1]|uniref:hypothetical protein n=1 Tax=Paenibacillus sp. NEAU-GSW1 TaxID=2682486 RepID=UPI0012E211B5|nr:hypothetical protein [Paenibacillus sp. NEAU-GSW1]MUT67598.1 hypothetical protein [Paenibacillus sp. NEAU-GSW1]